MENINFNKTLTITDEHGNSMTITGSVLNSMITSHIVMYNKMIEKKHNNPHLTREELVVDVKNLIARRDDIEKLLSITYDVIG